MKYLKSSYAASSLAYILIGLALLIWPELSLKVVCYLFGAVILLKGISSIWNYLRSEARFFFSYFSLTFGILAVALGGFLLFKPEMVVSVLPILVGLFVIFDGLVRFQSAFELKRAGHSSWWSFLLLALLSALLGGLMIFNPFASVQVLVMAIGVILIIEGAINLISSLYAGAMLKSLRKSAEKFSDAMGDFLDVPVVEEGGKDDTVIDVEYHSVDDN